MGIATYPAASAGGIKSVQRGSAAGSGNVTITSVDINKSFVTVFGTTSSGTVAASGSINASNGNISGANVTGSLATSFQNGTGGPGNAVAQMNNDANIMTRNFNQNFGLNSTTFAANSTNLTGGSNNLVAAVVQGYLSNSTTLVVSGACRWEVVEFN